MKTRSLWALFMGMLFVGLLVAQQPQQPNLPQREQLTAEKLFERLGRCSVDLEAEKTYEAQLVQRIRELEKENASLKAVKP